MESKTEGRESEGFVTLNGCQLEKWQDHLNHRTEAEFAGQIMGSENERLSVSRRWPFTLTPVKMQPLFDYLCDCTGAQAGEVGIGTWAPASTIFLWSLDFSPKLENRNTNTNNNEWSNISSH